MSSSRSNDGGTAEQQAFLRHLKEMGIQDSATSTTWNEFATVVPAAGSDASTNGPGSQGCTVGGSNNTSTKDLLQLLVSEIAHMRCTLDNSLAQDKALLAEVQLSNKLLALGMVRGRRLDYSDFPNTYVPPVISEERYDKIVLAVQGLENFAQIVLKTVSRDDSVKLKDV